VLAIENLTCYTNKAVNKSLTEKTQSLTQRTLKTE